MKFKTETTVSSVVLTNKIKVMADLSKMMEGWSVPFTKRGGRKLSFDMKVNFKYGHIYVNARFIKYKLAGLSLDPLKCAFRLVPEERAFAVFDPAKGVPFFMFPKTKKTTSPALINKALVEQFADKFGFTNTSPAADFELVPFERINGMLYFQIVLVGEKVN